MHEEYAWLWSFRPRLVALARRRGIPQRQVEDVAQDVLLGAWLSISAGRFTPADPTSPACQWAWLKGVAWRRMNNHMTLARYRHEVITADPYPPHHL